ncbi:MAG: hypothetical protein IJW23_03140 [Lentisphaeria bacterium]|nr:hypothetical protein [Lentisphaeria bacterium]
MTYYHNVQQTRNSGLDREMRLAAGEILSLFYSLFKSWLDLQSENQNHFGEFFVLYLFFVWERLRYKFLSFIG